MFLKERLFVLVDRIKENVFLIHVGLLLCILLGFTLAILGAKKKAFKFLSQAHRTGRHMFFKRAVEWWVIKNVDIHQVPVESYMSLADFKRCFGSRMMILKSKQSESEKGVLYVMYSELLHVIPKFMDIDKLSKDYKLVFEPSWSGYCTGSFLYYACKPFDSYFLAAQVDDYRFLQNFENLKACELGPCDWVDPKVAEPFLNQPKKYDIVMNSNWGAWKRHRVLFKALKKSKRDLKVALIGFDWGGRSKQDILSLAKAYGVDAQIEIFEKIPFDQVMNITCQSKLSVLLSLKEGSNRAVAESIFCDVPVIVLDNHVGGIVKNVNQYTGQLAPERNLTEVIHDILDSLDSYTPRNWGVEHIACDVSTIRLNEFLKSTCSVEEKWTRDVVVRSNSPESKYQSIEDKERFSQENEELKKYLIADEV